MAEPPEGLNTSDIEKEVSEVPLVNGNHVDVEDKESKPITPDVIIFIYIILILIIYIK